MLTKKIRQGVVIDSFIIHHWIAVVVFQSNAVVSCLRIAHHVVNRTSLHSITTRGLVLLPSKHRPIGNRE